MESTSAKPVSWLLFRQYRAIRPIAFPNTVKGIRKFIGLLSVTEHHCVMEATGNYGVPLLYMLDRQGIAACMVNPKQIKHFSRMMLTVTRLTPKTPA